MATCDLKARVGDKVLVIGGCGVPEVNESEVPDDVSDEKNKLTIAITTWF